MGQQRHDLTRWDSRNKTKAVIDSSDRSELKFVHQQHLYYNRKLVDRDEDLRGPTHLKAALKQSFCKHHQSSLHPVQPALFVPIMQQFSRGITKCHHSSTDELGTNTQRWKKEKPLRHLLHLNVLLCNQAFSPTCHKLYYYHRKNTSETVRAEISGGAQLILIL